MAYTDIEIVKLFKKHRSISKSGLSQQYDNTDRCFAFYDGDDMSYQDSIQFTDNVGQKKRALVNFSKVQSPVDAVVGFFAQNRRQAKFIARINSDQSQALYSKNMNAIYTYHRENTNADQLETEQDSDMFICGYGVIETDLSYIVGQSTSDPNGEIVKMKLDPRSTYWDPSDKSKNLLRSRWSGYHQDFYLTDALNLFQDSDKEDFEAVGEDEPESDTGYHYNPYGGLYDKIKASDGVEWTIKDQELVRVYNHQWMEYETFYAAKNPLFTATNPVDAMFINARLNVILAGIPKNEITDGIETEDQFAFDPKSEELTFDEKTKSILVKEFGKQLNPVPFVRKVFYTAIISGKHVFKQFKSISQQGYSIKFKTGVYNNTGKFWMGMVNPMMEPVDYYNKALTELMFTIAANSKGGVMVEEDAVEDISDFETKWAKTDAVIKVASGAISGGKIQQKAQGAVPTGLENIIQLSDAAISNAGIDPSFLGQMDDQDQSGILFKRRIRQVVSKFARFADSITLYQKEDARLHGDLIPIWVENNNGQWMRITGQDGADQFVQITQDMLAPQYDVDIQEMPQSSEDKQQTASILGTYGDKLIQFNPTAAQAFYAESINMLPIDGDVRNRLTQTLQPQPQQINPAMVQQMQQRIQELEGQANQADVAKKNADAAYSMARAKQTEVNNELIKSKIPQTHAQTAKTLEEASKIQAEVNIVQKTPSESATVSA